MIKENVKAKRDKFIVPGVKHLYSDPPLLVKGRGQYLYDDTGKEYLDMFGGIVTVSVGHCHPKVTERTVRQLQTLQHTSTVFMTAPMVDLAEKLSEITPGDLSKSFVTNSGSEANEAAVKLARLATGRSEVIALKHSYHGESHLTSSLTGNYNWRPELPPAQGVVFAENAYCYRCPFKKTPDSCGLECAQDIERTIQTATSGKPAVLIAEPVQGVGGVITPPQDYFKEVRRILDKYGALFIADEVQTGMGRTGNFWFGISNWEVTPDFVTMAKGLANGLPIGAVVTTPKIAEAAFKQQINTFGGNPVSSATALAVIETIEEEKLMENARTMGAYLVAGLKDLQRSRPMIGDVRGKGLMIGVEMVGENKTPVPAETGYIVETAKEMGVIVGKGGLFGNVVRIAPPMIVSKENVETFLNSFQQAIDSVAGVSARQG